MDQTPNRLIERKIDISIVKIIVGTKLKDILFSLIEDKDTRISL